jgi:large subunit ribosomal protein L11
MGYALNKLQNYLVQGKKRFIMAKKIIGNLKLRIPAGRATAGPPVGSTLGQWGLNVHIQVYEDRTFTWKSLGQPVDDAIRDAVGIKKGSAKPHLEKVGKITRAQLEVIAESKKDQLNGNDMDARVKTIAGTALSMGVEITD